MEKLNMAPKTTDSKEQNGQSQSDSMSLGTLADAIPQERREELEHLVDGSQNLMSRVRDFAVENRVALAVSVAGIAVAGAGLWALLATERGRKALASGKSLVMSGKTDSDTKKAVAASVIH
jgi:hypothetical protein